MSSSGLLGYIEVKPILKTTFGASWLVLSKHFLRSASWAGAGGWDIGIWSLYLGIKTISASWSLSLFVGFCDMSHTWLVGIFLSGHEYIWSSFLVANGFFYSQTVQGLRSLSIGKNTYVLHPTGAVCNLKILNIKKSEESSFWTYNVNDKDSFCNKRAIGLLSGMPTGSMSALIMTENKTALPQKKHSSAELTNPLSSEASCAPSAVSGVLQSVSNAWLVLAATMKKRGGSGKRVLLVGTKQTH